MQFRGFENNRMKLRYALLASDPKAKENEKLAEEGKPTCEYVLYSRLRAVED